MQRPPRRPAGYDELLTPGEVAKIFSVDPKTVARWAKAGKLPSTQTPGGHRRYRRLDVRAALMASDENGDGAP
jgi:excisionase family DNA binding protein